MILDNMNRANAVLSVIKGLTYDEDQRVYSEPYQNGREHGWSLQWEDSKVCFSEYRNTDNIVVYYGKSIEFSMQGNTPNDRVYNTKKFFRYDEFVEAAQFIINYLGLK
jgi:hypothetical protein